MQATTFKEGPVTIDNNEHQEFTVVTIIVAIEVEGALLKVASALTNSGCSIQEGSVEVRPLPIVGHWSLKPRFFKSEYRKRYSGRSNG